MDDREDVLLPAAPGAPAVPEPVERLSGRERLGPIEGIYLSPDLWSDDLIHWNVDPVSPTDEVGSLAMLDLPNGREPEIS